MSTRLPEPPEAGLLNALRFGTDTFRFLEGIQARFDDGTSVSIPGRPPLVVLTGPDLVGEALDRPEDFPRVPAQDAVTMIAENGLVQSEGALWSQQRSVMAPSFSGEQVTAYANTTGRRIEARADQWAAAGARTTDLHREMTSLTVRVASEILLGEDIGTERADQFHEWMQVAGEEFEFGIETVLPDWVPTPTSGEFEQAAAGIRELSEQLIERRRESLAAGERPDASDMLTMLIRAEDNPDIDYPENQIRDEVATFLIAGHETTALSLTYTLCLLSWHPEARRRVRQEADEALGDGPPTHDDLAELTYTRRVYDEALRLYPPAWGVFRQANGDVTLGQYTIPDGSAVIMPLWSIHRDGSYFEQPDTFDPDRWERRTPRAVDAYRPFSSGPHACIGRGFALAGSTLVLARLVRDFDIDVPESALDDLRLTPTLRPADGVEATIQPVGGR
ncbi:cytochrome P450 [Natronomonas pharaonis DSM 2160]|uniref:Cytochrome P450 n=1 Tax=Natronomonas pharaonis (strain ATCC 35678 / DSM 2160 / CIP 103997 / JCM 8858 / NBRC 14720 / NCIMB 2260 / Gabara) TaxID=348780 RepID=A0A1U7EWA2_NATPD|nr:cytochrome P450 [Natronomonas pharaonis]CAI49361.1 cytochrome P450 [Natronomonas pharaonis DSM 2160]